MNIVFLSGGSGKRLWPLSNEIRSKQFIKFFKSGCTCESMVQRMYRLLKKVDPNATITIATGKNQVSAIHSQLGDDVGISVEPCRKDTFPAIALVSSYLHDVRGFGVDEAVVVCPVDPYVDDDYFYALKDLWNLAQNGAANLILMGVSPSYPSEKYGYIIPSSKDHISSVTCFKEKPKTADAEKYIQAGGLWNSGVFAFKLKYVLDRAHELFDFNDYYDLFSKYEKMQRISFDYAVAEHEKNIVVQRFAGEWKDLGTWNTLSEAMDGYSIGKVILNETCSDVHVINELDVPILVVGGKDLVIAASPEGVLVSDKEESTYIKPYVDSINQQIMFAEKSWGSYRVLDVGEKSLTVKVCLNPKHGMQYHSHNRRAETWSVISGTGHVIINGKKQGIKAGDFIDLPIGCKHTVIASKHGLQIIEVQVGDDISVSDKVKHEL